MEIGGKSCICLEPVKIYMSQYLYLWSERDYAKM